MRVLVPIVGQGSITHIIRTGLLNKLREFCTPVVAFAWDQEDLKAELVDKGYEVVTMPSYKISLPYYSVRSKINLWYIHNRLKTPSINIQQKYLSTFHKDVSRATKVKKLKDKYYKLRFAIQPKYVEQLLEKEASIVTREEAYLVYQQWLAELKIDSLFTVTPFLAEVDLIGRLLRKQGKRIIASIHSFDNVTKRGWPSTFFDHYLVWNRYNKEELQRINPALKKEGSITVAGAPQFDFHFNKHFLWTRDEWEEKLELPKGKRVILYSGGHERLLPNEPQYIKHLEEAFQSGKLLADAVVLFRCHPLDNKNRWIKSAGDTKNIIYDSAPMGERKADHTNVTIEDIKKLMSTLAYCEIHINVVSTMAVDGSAFNKPQIGPYYDTVTPASEELFRKMYFQEHYLPIIRSKAVNLAYTKAQFIELVSDALANPDKYNGNCDRCVQEIITYRDGKSTERAADAIKRFFTR